MDLHWKIETLRCLGMEQFNGSKIMKIWMQWWPISYCPLLRVPEITLFNCPREQLGGSNYSSYKNSKALCNDFSTRHRCNQITTPVFLGGPQKSSLDTILTLKQLEIYWIFIPLHLMEEMINRTHQSIHYVWDAIPNRSRSIFQVPVFREPFKDVTLQ